MQPIVLIGSPGSGKGTQGNKLADYFGIPHISTGEMLRDHVQRGTTIGCSVMDAVSKGLLVPDEFMTDLIVSRLKAKDCANGYVLDGFPRTLQQAEWFRPRYPQPVVILLDVPEKEVLRRIAARNEGRPDDKSVDIARDRLREYGQLTAPLIGYYDKETDFYRVDGTIGIDNAFEKIKSFLEPVAWG